MIPMQQNSIDFLIGSQEMLDNIRQVPADAPFDENRIAFLDTVSKALRSDPRSRRYPEIATFAFWIRKSNMSQMARRFESDYFRLGRGVIFHVAPSNVAVNYAYSFAAGFITGNINIVRVPSKEFEQITIINDAIAKVLDAFPEYAAQIFMVRYGHEKEVNDFFSDLCDVRVIWGGDSTIATFRQSPIRPRTREITFADRYSLAVIDAALYLAIKNKERIAHDFYNDTWLTDQNACTSPRLVVWLGKKSDVKKAQNEFWEYAYKYASEHYQLQDIQGVDKLTNLYLAAASVDGIDSMIRKDSLLYRVELDRLDSVVIKYRGDSGFFYEYHASDIMNIREFCDNDRIQTVGLIGDKSILIPLLDSGIRGIDRVKDIGHTMDFDLGWI